MEVPCAPLPIPCLKADNAKWKAHTSLGVGFPFELKPRRVLAALLFVLKNGAEQSALDAPFVAGDDSLLT